MQPDLLSAEASVDLVQLQSFACHAGSANFNGVPDLWQVALDELTFGPLHVGVFFAFMTKAQGGTWEVRCLCRCTCSTACSLACPVHVFLSLPHGMSSRTSCAICTSLAARELLQWWSCCAVQDVNQKLRRDFWSAYIAELAVWPAFQTWNFSKVCPSSLAADACHLACYQYVDL